MRDRLIKDLDSADLFLRNRATSSPALLNEQDIEEMLDIAKICDEAARTLEKTIIPPCKVGDLLYMPWEYDGTSGVALLGVTYMVIDKDGLRIMTDFSTDDDVYYDLYFGGKFVPSDFGKTVFLTREEAKQKLKKGAE